MIWVVTTFVVGFSYVHAEASQISSDDSVYCITQSSICWTAPHYFTLLLDFVREMMNSIKTIGTQWAYVGKYINPNRFEGATFVAPKTNIITATTRNITQKLNFGVASVAIVTSPVNGAGLKDVWGWLSLLFKNKVFLRDNLLVEELESQLSDKKLELGLGGGWFTPVNVANRTLMKNIIQKYIDNWLFIDGTISDGVLYNTITSLLTQLLSSAKTVLYLDSVSQLDNISRGGSSGVTLVFNTSNIQAIQRDYTCAKWFINPCDSSLQAFSGAIASLLSDLETSTTSSYKTITNALDRLKQIFSKQQTTSFIERESELLKSMYGTQKVNKWTLLRVKYDKSIVQNIKNVGVAVGQNATSLWTFVSKGIQQKKQVVETSIDKENIVSVSTPAQWQPLFEQYIGTYLQDVFNQQSIDAELATFVEVDSVTPAFTVLSQQISTIKKDILGGKDQEGSLLKNLWVACELQCGGSRGLCRE